MSNTLLPCPFCGGEALMRERYINGIANTKHYLQKGRRNSIPAQVGATKWAKGYMMIFTVLMVQGGGIA